MFAHSYASHYVTLLHQQLLIDISKSKFDLLEIIHHYSSGMKSVYTDYCYYSLIQIRQCLGGAGYSAWSGIPELIADYSPQVTYEGDNTLMSQQSNNFLFKQARRALKGKKTIGGPMTYMEEMNDLVHRVCKGSTVDHFLNIDHIDEALKVNVAHALKSVMSKMENSKAPKKNFLNVLNGIDVVSLSQTHINYVTFWMFKDAISGEKIKNANNKKNMQNLLMLFGLN